MDPVEPRMATPFVVGLSNVDMNVKLGETVKLRERGERGDEGTRKRGETGQTELLEPPPSPLSLSPKSQSLFSEETEFELGHLTHHVLRPRWVEHDIDLRARGTVDRAGLFLHFGGQAFGDWAIR